MIEYINNRHVFSGQGALFEINNLLKWYGKKHVFLVAYHKDADSVKKVMQDLAQAGIAVTLYDKIVKEPDLAVIDDGAKVCVDEKCDAVIAIGGGSVIDGAKTISMIAANGGFTEDYQLNGKEVLSQPLLFIAVPTTAGTGAEATKVSVVYNENKGYKKAIYHTSMIAQAVILDPETTIGLPPNVTAATGMDAITHAIESYTSVFANTLSQMYSLKALALLSQNIVKAYVDPKDLQARENMLLGSYLAGCAITVGTCLAHIVGQPLGAIYHIPHGDACSIFLIPSMKLNMDHAVKQYADIAKTLGVEEAGRDEKQVALAGIAVLEDITKKINAPTKLTDYIEKDKIDVAAALDNIQTSMGHIKTNPRPVSRALFEEIIRSVM